MTLRAGFAALLVLSVAQVSPGPPPPGAAAYSGKDPIGGGPAYSRIADPKQAAYVVSDLPGLKNALAKAASGQTVYVDDKAVIDLTGEPTLEIPGGVTLASGRGRGGSGGGLVRTSTIKSNLFLAGAPGVRVTGLGIQGPSPGFPKGDPPLPTSNGIVAQSEGLEVDNCEISAFSYGGVWLTKGSSGSRVHHCYIHHCQRDGLGYGVVLHESDGIIEANRFAENRHDIAANGRAGTSYVARYNISEAIEPPIGHAFDMHGNHESRPPGELYEHFAGDRLIIYNNTFRSTRPRNCITVRGRPRKQLLIHGNLYENALVGVWLRDPCNNAVIYRDSFGREPQIARYRLVAPGNTLDGRRMPAGDVRGKGGRGE